VALHRESTQDITIPETGQEVLEGKEEGKENNVMIVPIVSKITMTLEEIAITDKEALLITNTADVPELLPPSLVARPSCNKVQDSGTEWLLNTNRL